MSDIDFKNKLKSIQFAGKKSSATTRESQWSKDMAAYGRMRKEGLQPPQIDGCAALEAKATTKFEVDMGRILTAEQMVEAKKSVRQAADIRMGL